MDKLKLFRNFILISIPLFVLCVLAYVLPFAYMSTEYVIWYEEYANSDSPAIDAKTVLVGDSRAKSSILPALLHEDTYNIAIGGATPMEMYYATRNYIEKNGAPQNAIVTFAPYHFCDIDNWDQALYYNFLKPGEVFEIYTKALELKDPVITKKGRIGEMVSYRLRLPSKYLSQMYEGKFTGNLSSNQERFDQIRGDLGYCEFGNAAGDDGLTHECYHEYFDYIPIVTLYYDRLLKLLIDNNVNVVVVQPPINQASSDGMHQEFLDGFTGYMEDIAEKYPQITVFPEIPVYDNIYFGDSIHVNRKGAALFTGDLKDKLEGIGYWDKNK